MQNQDSTIKKEKVYFLYSLQALCQCLCLILSIITIFVGKINTKFFLCDTDRSEGERSRASFLVDFKKKTKEMEDESKVFNASK